MGTYVDHLSEPIEHHFLLVVGERVQIHEERFLPEDLGVGDHLVDQVKATH
jgi:hypothetical protein